MNIIYSNFDELKWINFIEKLNLKLKTKNSIHIDYQEFINFYKKKLKNKNCNYVFYNMHDLVLNNFKNNFKTKNYIHNNFFFSHFVIINEMIKKFDPYNNLSINDVKNHYNISINYWMNFLKKNKIDLVFSKITPNNFYDYVIYLCCKKLGIKFIFFDFNYIKDIFSLCSNIHNKTEIKKIPQYSNNFNYKKVLKNKIVEINKKNFSKPNYSKIVRLDNIFFFKIYLKIIIKKFLFSFYKRNLIYDYCFFNNNIKSSYNKITYFEKVNFDFWLIKKKYNFLQNYKKLSSRTIFDKNEKYFLFLSQFKPECTSCPDGWKFNDDLHVIKLLFKLLPSKYKIYYKAHPATFFPDTNYHGCINLDSNYYEKLKNYKNLKIIPVESNTKKMILNSELVVTIAGQAGFEASILNKKSLTFVKTWYSNLNSNLVYSSKLTKTKIVKFLNKKIENNIFSRTKKYFLNSFKSNILFYNQSNVNTATQHNKLIKYVLNYINLKK